MGGAGRELFPGEVGEVTVGGLDLDLEASGFGRADLLPDAAGAPKVDFELRESLPGGSAVAATRIRVVGQTAGFGKSVASMVETLSCGPGRRVTPAACPSEEGVVVAFEIEEALPRLVLPFGE